MKLSFGAEGAAPTKWLLPLAQRDAAASQLQAELKATAEKLAGREDEAARGSYARQRGGGANARGTTVCVRLDELEDHAPGQGAQILEEKVGGGRSSQVKRTEAYATAQNRVPQIAAPQKPKGAASKPSSIGASRGHSVTWSPSRFGSGTRL